MDLLSAAANVPVEIDLDRKRALTIVWSDGVRSTYPLALLRRECPCALCRQSRLEQGGQRLPVVQPAAQQQLMAVADTLELVGNYAIRILWKDGHATGIYDFGLLRSLSPASREPDRPPAV